MNTLPFIVQGNNIVVVIENRSHTISKKTHIAYNKVLDAIKAQDWQAVCDLIEPKKVILKYGAGNLSIQGEDVFYKGEKMDNSLTRRMVSMFRYVHSAGWIWFLIAAFSAGSPNASKPTGKKTFCPSIRW